MTEQDRTHVYAGQPDGRQSESVAPPDRFASRYRKMEPEEVALHDEIKKQATVLDKLLMQVQGAAATGFAGDGDAQRQSDRNRCLALARTNLEQAVMWAVKGLTK